MHVLPAAVVDLVSTDVVATGATEAAGRDAVAEVGTLSSVSGAGLSVWEADSSVVVEDGLVESGLVLPVSADDWLVAEDAPEVVGVAGLGVRVTMTTGVELVVTARGLVAMVTCAVAGLMVDLSVILGVTLVVTGALGVVLRVVVAGVALVVDPSRVVSFSGTAVGLGAVDVDVNQTGAGVEASVDASTISLSGLSVVVPTPAGALVGAAGAPGSDGGGATLLVVAALSVADTVDIVDCAVVKEETEVAVVRGVMVKGTAVDVAVWTGAAVDSTVGL